MIDAIKLFIVEGVEKDYRFVKGMTDLFMRGKFAAKIIYLPAAQNISVIDGCDNKKVFIPFGDEKENFALPKMQFAKMVLAAEKPFDNMNFDGFLPLFEKLKRILDEESAD